MSRILEQLKAVPIFGNSILNDEYMGYTKWLDANKPHAWYPVETKGDYTVYLDSGFGYIALFHDDNLIGWGRDQITDIGGYPELLILNAGVCGVGHWIWSPMEA